MPIEPLALPMAEALEFWLGLGLVTREEFDQLAAAAQATAFTVSGVAALDELADVHSAVRAAVESGETIQDFRGRIADIIARKGWADWRVDTIFQTNIQSAYQAGRYKQLVRVAERRPYWRYVAVKDKRTRPSHGLMHGKVFRHDDPVWDVWYPPNGYRCRCTIQSLSERQVERYGYEIETKAPAARPDEGFRTNAAKNAWTPDMTGYPPELAAAYEGLSQ